MIFQKYFADAESSFNDADFILYGVPYDKSSSFRVGSSQAPNNIRLYSWNFETYNIKTGFDLSNVKIHDYGDLDVENKSLIDMIKIVRSFTKKILKNKKIPIAIGGDHSITTGIVQAFPKNISVISLDAHIDFRDKYNNEKYNHACVSRRISDYIGIENIAILGLRSAEKEEYENAINRNLFFKDVFTIQKDGINKIISQTLNYLKNKKIYLTIDIDVIDPAYAPGTSTPEPFGLTPYDILKCIENFSPYLIGFDIVEVCPLYDNGQTSLLASKFIRNLIENVVIYK